MNVIARLRGWLAKPGTLVAVGVGLVVGLGFAITNFAVMLGTGTETFCSQSCHEMTNNVYAEYKGTIHDVNRTGVRAVCPDCHVPKAIVPLYLRKMGTWSDLWGHFVTRSINTKEKFEAKRYELAKRVWLYMQENDSRECRSCHTDAKMDLARQSEKAQKRHAKAVAEKLTCVDCHFAIAHNEPLGGPGPQELRHEGRLKVAEN